MRKIYLPIIENIEVDGYVLYPGTDAKPGLVHEFLPGVNVIVGINGIGKTTLLLLLLRMLTGNKELRDRDELGGAQRSLTSIDSGLFAVRVPDRARGATAKLRFKLGARTIEITRSLSNLQIQELRVDPAEPNLLAPEMELEDQYKFAVCRLAALDDFFDFVLLLRYLTFYLEDRRSLIWDKWAQTEVLRILFVPMDMQQRYKEKLGTALSADSAARNTQSVLTREQQRLTRLLVEAAQSTPDELRLLRVQVNEKSARSEELGEILSSLDEKRRSRRKDAEQRRHDAERLAQEERGIREALLASLFPKLNDYGAFVLANIQSDRGCIVCGSTDRHHLEKVIAEFEKSHRCPVCQSDPSSQEKVLELNSSAELPDQLKAISVERRAATEAAKSAEDDAAAAFKEYLKVQGERDQLNYDLKNDQQKLELKEQLAQGTKPDQLARTDDRVRVLRESVAEQIQIKDEALRDLSTLIEQLSGSVNQFKERLIEIFNGFVRSFLAERCDLDYRTVLRRIGQGSSMQIAFPEFHVLMTSGVFRQSGTAREEPDSVSESQKEFIELAFRMTFLAVTSEHDSCSLIIETPEASLDAVFIPKAGSALNSFARNSYAKHTVLATSNLNGSKMIPALLGLLEESAGRVRWASRQDSRKYVLNLIDSAAKSQAMRDYESEYQQRFEETFNLAGAQDANSDE